MKGLYRDPRTGIYFVRKMVDGKRIYQSLSTKEKREAEYGANKIFNELSDGKYRKPTKTGVIFLKEAINSYFNHVRAKPSFREDERLLGKFQIAMGKQLGKSVTLQMISRFDIECFLDELVNKGRSDATRNRYLSAIKTLFNIHMEWKKISENPAMGIKKRHEEPRNRYLWPGQIRALLDASGSQLRPILEVLVHTGFREKDVFHLQWNNIDFENGVINIVQSKTKRQLQIEMSDHIAQMLSGIPRRPNCPYVFPNSEGRPLHKDSWVRTQFKAALKTANITDFTIRDLRRCAGTAMAFEGENEVTIARQLGHSTTRVTETYVVAAREVRRRAANKLSRLILGPANELKQPEIVSKLSANDLNNNNVLGKHPVDSNIKFVKISSKNE